MAWPWWFNSSTVGLARCTGRLLCRSASALHAPVYLGIRYNTQRFLVTLAKPVEQKVIGPMPALAGPHKSQLRLILTQGPFTYQMFFLTCPCKCNTTISRSKFDFMATAPGYRDIPKLTCIIWHYLGLSTFCNLSWVCMFSPKDIYIYMYKTEQVEMLKLGWCMVHRPFK